MHESAPRFAPPPRRVPFSLVVANVCNGFGQVGWFLFSFGMLFFWVFAAQADLSFASFRGALQQARGEVLRVEETNASENEQRVYANHYAFSLAGRQHTGVSYATGERAEVGAAVPVEYDPNDPGYSRIAGMRRSMFGPWVLLVVIFPLIALGIIYFSVRSGLRRARLLRDGVATTGKLIGKEATNVRVNKRRVYELTFAFQGRDGQRHEAITRTNNPGSLEDDTAEPLLYDPNDPTCAYLLDELPSRPQVDGLGELQGRPVAALFLVIIPLVAITANVAAVLYKLGLLKP